MGTTHKISFNPLWNATPTLVIVPDRLQAKSPPGEEQAGHRNEEPITKRKPSLSHRLETEFMVTAPIGSGEGLCHNSRTIRTNNQ